MPFFDVARELLGPVSGRTGDQRSSCLTRSTKAATWSAAKRMLLKPSMFHSLEISAPTILGGRPPRPVAAAQFRVCRVRSTFPPRIMTRPQGSSPACLCASNARPIHPASATARGRSAPPMLIVLMRGSRDESIRTLPPLSLQISHPDSRILEFAAFAVAIHQQYGHSALAGPGERHLGREQAGLVAVRPTSPDSSPPSGLGNNGLQREWQRGGVPNLVTVLRQEIRA